MHENKLFHKKIFLFYYQQIRQLKRNATHVSLSLKTYERVFK